MPPRRARRREGAEALKERIKREFRTPGHPVAFSAPHQIARRYNVSERRAREILEEVPSYVTHREYKRPSVFNPYYVRRRRELVQSDLIDLTPALARRNDDIRYLLVIIDVFTKKAWVYPLTNKSAPTMERALNDWLSRDVGRQKPEFFSSDRGNEYANARVRDLLERNGVRQLFASGTCKAAVAERFNKSFQILIYKYLTDRQLV